MYFRFAILLQEESLKVSIDDSKASDFRIIKGLCIKKVSRTSVCEKYCINSMHSAV